ncbi:MAG: hypothetical protein KDA24_29370 [Deltaproteobacteria bacterium]|nr:hypothetical protein [Deltaproteobacteria bacterium]
MAFEHEKQTAQRILSGLEDARLSTFQTSELVEEADPALVYFLFAWLRSKYPSHHPASDGVLGRLGALCTEHPSAARKAHKGQKDSIVAWFEEGHSYRDFTSSEFISLVVDKLES